MAVYFFTLHAYRSWRPDHPRGYVRRGEGILPSEPKRAAQYDANAKQEPAIFAPEMQRVMIAGAADICAQRQWRLHAIGFEPNHVHLLVSWRDFTDWLEVRAKLKNLLSLFLGRLVGIEGRTWFTDAGSRKRVATRDHFDYLIGTYIPKHSEQKWFEGDPLPTIPAHVLRPPPRIPHNSRGRKPRFFVAQSILLPLHHHRRLIHPHRRDRIRRAGGGDQFQRVRAVR
jgi:REP element-mobilizing transposase RayT